MARSKLERYDIERIFGKRQRMGVADVCMDRKIALARAALTFGCHVRTAVHGMDLERWVNRKKPQRDVVHARTNVEHVRSPRQMFMDRGGELGVRREQLLSDATALP